MYTRSQHNAKLCRHEKGNPRPTGYTLIELAIVVLIIGIFAAAAAPTFYQSLLHHQVESAARRVKLDLELAQRRAKTRGTSHTVSFDVVNNTYTLVGVEDLENSSATYSVDLTQPPYQAALFDVVLGGDDELIFDGYGLPDSDASIGIAVGTHELSVVVDADSAQVTIE